MPPFVPFASDDEILFIAEGLIERSLPKAAFTHAAHFSAALWLLTRHPVNEVQRDMPGLIRAFNEAVGGANTATDGYHETITQASIRAAAWFLAASQGRPLYATANALMASPFGKPEWLLAFWSKPRLFSVEARRTWVEPDIQSLPF
jgi:hypothetical protein